MQDTKVKSFTLSEMLVVMIITAIVVGLAFSILSLVQRQIHTIKSNFDTTTELALMEQRMWQDFYSHNSFSYYDRNLYLLSSNDTVTYTFSDDFTLRNTDTIRTSLTVSKLFYMGRDVISGPIDAIAINAEAELPGYSFFIFSTPDATQKMNEHDF